MPSDDAIVRARVIADLQNRLNSPGVDAAQIINTLESGQALPINLGGPC